MGTKVYYFHMVGKTGIGETVSPRFNHLFLLGLQDGYKNVQDGYCTPGKG